MNATTAPRPMARSLLRLQEWHASRSRARRRARAASGKTSKTMWLPRVLMMVSFALLGAFLLSEWYINTEHAPGKSVPYSNLVDMVKKGDIAELVVLAEDGVVIARPYSDTNLQTVHATVPENDSSLTQVAAAIPTAPVVYVDPQSAKKALKAVTTFLLPILVLVFLFAWLVRNNRGSSGGMGDVVNFSKIAKGKSVAGGATPITFEDVGGAGEAVVELREVRDYLVDPGRYERLGAAPPKGVMLFGPPGTGKTLLARAVAGEAGVPFFSVAGAEFVESLVGVGAARVRDLFSRVRAAAPAILFIDEIDAAGRRRSQGGGSGGSDEREQTLNQLLVEMDGFEVTSGVVVIAATNRPDILDPALMRPGRFDRHITIERPTVGGREQILRIHAKNKPLADDVDMAVVAARTPGFTGADLANVLNEATLLAIRAHRATVGMPDIVEAIDRVEHGPKRRGDLLTEEDQYRLASHEAGHAVAAYSLNLLNSVQKFSILTHSTSIRSGQTGEHPVTESELRRQLVAAVSGYVAERTATGEKSTNCEQDLLTATKLARVMVSRFGMATSFGTARLADGSGRNFLDGEVTTFGVSERLRWQADQDVCALIAESERAASELLDAQANLVMAVRDALLTQETVEAAEIEDLHNKSSLETKKYSRKGKATREGQVSSMSRLPEAVR